MKRNIAVLLCCLLIGTLAACGSSETSGSQSETTTTASEVGSATAAASETGSATSADSNMKALVAYFAYSENIGDTSNMEVDAITSASLNANTNNIDGNLQVMAQVVAEKTGADIFHILVTEPYAMDYSTMLPMATRQMQNDERPKLQESIDDLEQYDVIYIGTPVWNAELPPAMLSFFDEYDFTGKTIVPLGIHLGSRFGKAISQMEELEPGAEILEGYTVNAETPNEEVKTEFGEWLDSAGLVNE